MNIDLIISEKYNSLSKTEKKLADYFLSDTLSSKEKFNISDLSNKVSVGQATILRFVKKLGFNSYAEFKIKLRRDLYSKEIRLENTYQYEKMLKEALDFVDTQIDKEMFKKTAQTVYNSDYIYLYGLGYSKIIAELLAYQLFRCGKKTHIISENHEFKMAVSLAKENECIILVSRSGLTKEIIDICKDIKETKIPTIAFTENKDSYFAHIVDQLIIIPPISNYANNMGFMITFMQNGILELWYRYYKSIDTESLTNTQDKMTASIAEYNSELQ